MTGVLLLGAILLANLAAYLRISQMHERVMFQLDARQRLLSGQSTAPRRLFEDPPLSAVDAGGSLNDDRLRQIVSDALAGLPESPCLSEATAATPEPDADAIRAARDEANAVLAAAADRGIWDLDSARAFEAAVARLPAEEQASAYNAQAAALNSGRIRLDDDTDPALLLMGGPVE